MQVTGHKRSLQKKKKKKNQNQILKKYSHREKKPIVDGHTFVILYPSQRPMSYKMCGLFGKAESLRCHVDSACCRYTPSTFYNAPLPELLVPNPVSQTQAEGKNGRKGQKSPNHLSKYLSGFVLSMNMFDMSVCLQVLSPHVCTRLLTFTVYSWLGCEPGALQSRAASPHRFRTLTTRGLTLC